MQSEILIAGAGLAGLSLASALERENIPFALVEARERSGGRMLTLENEIDGIGNTLVDIGPSWIWPGQPRVEKLLQRFGIDTFEQYSSGLLVYEDEAGQVRRDLDYATMAGSLRIRGGIARLARALAERLPVERLWYRHRVTRVEQHRQGYRIDLDHDGQHLQLQAARVVLAIPPRVVLRDITFQPALDEAVSRDLASIPTWMAAHAKLFALYPTPFWRDLGLSGDAISRQGPLMEIHDASPPDAAYGALFGFVGVAAGSPLRQPARLAEAACAQLERLFGAAAASPADVQIKDWSADPYTATPQDQLSTNHPSYGMPASLARLAGQGLLFASTEMAHGFGGFIEGALEAAENALAGLKSAG